MSITFNLGTGTNTSPSFQTGGVTTPSMISSPYSPAPSPQVPPATLAVDSPVSTTQPQTQQAVVSAGPATQQVSESDQLFEAIVNAIRDAQQKKEESDIAEQQQQQTTALTSPIETGVGEVSEHQEYMDSLFKQIDSEVDMLNEQLEARRAMLDEQTQATISSIQSTYERLRRQEKEQTEARVGALEVLGVRSGRARYAGEVHQSILSAEQERSLNRLSELESEELSLISQAQQARNEEDWEMFTIMMDSVQNSRREKTQLVQQMFDNAMAEENLMMARTREERQAITWAREEMESSVAYLAPVALDNLSPDDPEYNLQIIIELAEEYNVDPNMLLAGVNQLSRDRYMEEAKLLPAEVREYEYAVRQGTFNGSFLDYVGHKAATRAAASASVTSRLPKLKTITVDGRLIRQIVNPMTGETLGEYDLGSSTADPNKRFISFLGSGGAYQMVDSETFAVDASGNPIPKSSDEVRQSAIGFGADLTNAAVLEAIDEAIYKKPGWFRSGQEGIRPTITNLVEIE